MPLRKWMSEHGHPGWYSWLVVIGGCLASMIVSVSISVQMNERALQRDGRQRAERQAEGRRVACQVIVRMRNAYAEQEKLTPAGQDVERAWGDLARLYQCTLGE